jgi:hypothetical protein
LKFFINTLSKKWTRFIAGYHGIRECMQNDKEGKSIEPIIADLPYETGLSVAKPTG